MATHWQKKTGKKSNVHPMLFQKLINSITKDQFIIPRHHSSLFTSKTLEQGVKQDIDSMKCWLRSYEEAVATQKEASRRCAEALKHFFKPRRLPINNPQKLRNDFIQLRILQ